MPFAERKTYCNLEASRGVGKTRRVRAALESLWENFILACPAARDETSFFTFFFYFVRVSAACENATFSRGVFASTKMELRPRKGRFVARARENVEKCDSRPFFHSVVVIP